MKDLIGALLADRPRQQQSLLKLATYPRFHVWKRANHGMDTINGGQREKRNALFRTVAEAEDLLASEIAYLEFGVHRGESIAWWYENNSNPASVFFGFDSFEGLPEDWTPEKGRGAFDTGGSIPETDDLRVEFVRGLFNVTLPNRSDILGTARRKVVHLDADLYRSTIYPLLILGPFLRPGDILIFDEFADSIHEFRAYEDFCQIFGVHTSLLAATEGFVQAGFRIEAIGTVQ